MRSIFTDNEMDGESLEALLADTPGPNCLRELIPKLGVRLRIYQRIRLLYSSRSQAQDILVSDAISGLNCELYPKCRNILFD